jgi:hypothetical protein
VTLGSAACLQEFVDKPRCEATTHRAQVNGQLPIINDQLICGQPIVAKQQQPAGHIIRVIREIRGQKQLRKQQAARSAQVNDQLAIIN